MIDSPSCRVCGSTDVVVMSARSAPECFKHFVRPTDIDEMFKKHHGSGGAMLPRESRFRVCKDVDDK